MRKDIFKFEYPTLLIIAISCLLSWIIIIFTKNIMAKQKNTNMLEKQFIILQEEMVEILNSEYMGKSLEN